MHSRANRHVLIDQPNGRLNRNKYGQVARYPAAYSPRYVRNSGVGEADHDYSGPEAERPVGPQPAMSPETKQLIVAGSLESMNWPFIRRPFALYAKAAGLRSKEPPETNSLGVPESPMDAEVAELGP